MFVTSTRGASARVARNVGKRIKSTAILSRQPFTVVAVSEVGKVSACRPTTMNEGTRSFSGLSFVASRTLSTSRTLMQSEGRAKAREAEPEVQEHAQPRANVNNKSERAEDEGSERKEIPPEWWISALEDTSNAPWLFHLPNEPVDRLKRAFTLIYQIILYLGRPQEEDAATQFLTAFGSAVVPPESEIGRARRAVANIMRAIVHDISSIPLNSPLRDEQADLFIVFGALPPLHDVYLENMREGDVDAAEWSEFWRRAEPVLLSLGETLDQRGFGLELDEERAAGKDDDPKDKKSD